MSNKLKRKITLSLNTHKTKVQAKARPSVFERLGIKAGTTSSHKDFCHHWAQSGSCPYGKGCKYSATHTLISPSKQRAAKIQTEPKKRHAKDGQKRPHVVGVEPEWNVWDPDELEDADPDDLERKRQELQRELELQMKMEHKARKREKKTRKDSSPSSDSSSTSSYSSSSSDDSSSTSSTSVETKRKKSKKTKSKRSSSSSSDDRSRKHKKTKRSSKSATRDKSKKTRSLSGKLTAKSPSPVRVKKKSETPPIRPIKLAVKKDSSETKSPRPLSRSSDRKEKHRTPSPKISRDKEREKEREREKEKEREKEREKEKEREREREREKEREKEREREREKERAKQREKEREKEKKRDSSPKRDARTGKDSKRRDSPDSSHSRDKKSPSARSKTGNASKRDKSLDRRDKRDERDRSRAKDRSIGGDKSRKDKRDSRDRDRDRERDRRVRDERESAREKERVEALARCQERQRERDRLKEMEKKDGERRGRDRGRRDDRGLDKPSDRTERLLPLPEDRIPPGRRHSPDRDRAADRQEGRGRSADTRKSSRKSPDGRHDRLDRDMHDRAFERTGYDREHDERSRGYGRIRDDRRLEDKDYNSPYDRNRHDDRRYMEMDDHYTEGARDADRLPIDRDYVDDRRGPRREIWGDMRDDRVDIESCRNFGHRVREYGRGAPGPGPMKGRDEWVEPEYQEHEWDGRSRRPMDWENNDGWDNMERSHISEEEWRHYNNRSMESWPQDDNRRRWPKRNDWRDRDNSRPRSNVSHNVDSTLTEAAVDTRREVPPATAPQPTVEVNIAESTSEPKTVEGQSKEVDQTPTKRTAEGPPEGGNDIKKPCLKNESSTVLEDDLSEISDDADEILNRDEEILEEAKSDLAQSQVADPKSLTSVQEQTVVAAAFQKSQSPLRSPAKSLQKDESIDGDNMDLDFEEISEDELDEESRIKGIGDALGVDWASLVAESRPRVKPISSAKLRWESHNILVNLGISVELAGENLVKDILKEHAEAELKHEVEEKEKKIVKVKLETVEVNGVKQEIKEEAQEPIKDDFFEEPRLDVEDLNISHPVAAIQVANQETHQIRRALFSSVGPFRRALSARRDLTIRRHLCNLPINDTYVEAPKRHDPELFKVATQLFERCL